MRNTSELVSGITGEVSETVHVLSLVLTVQNFMIPLIFITTALMIVNPAIPLSAIIGFGGCYLLFLRLTRRRLRDGHTRRAARRQPTCLL